MAWPPSGTRRRPPHWLALGLGLAMSGLPACGDASREPASNATPAPGAASAAPAPAAPAARREALRRLALAEAAHGGHGPLPQRGVNAQGLARLQAAWRPGDGPLCVDLLTDDDPVVRLSCTHLLARQEPGAAALVQARIDATPAGPARQHLTLALIDIQTAAPPPN